MTMNFWISLCLKLDPLIFASMKSQDPSLAQASSNICVTSNVKNPKFKGFVVHRSIPQHERVSVGGRGGPHAVTTAATNVPRDGLFVGSS